jgi:hypothetical protein
VGVPLLDVEVRPVLPPTTGSPAYAGVQVLATAIRHLMTYVVWAVAAALVTAALCWCCGQGARAAWARIGPPARRDDVHREAVAGIREIETFLAARADHT